MFALAGAVSWWPGSGASRGTGSPPACCWWPRQGCGWCARFSCVVEIGRTEPRIGLMENRKITRLGREVSAVGLGCWQLGADWGQVDESDALGVLHAAADAGVTFF